MVFYLFILLQIKSSTSKSQRIKGTEIKHQVQRMCRTVSQEAAVV